VPADLVGTRYAKDKKTSLTRCPTRARVAAPLREGRSPRSLKTESYDPREIAWSPKWFALDRRATPARGASRPQPIATLWRRSSAAIRPRKGQDEAGLRSPKDSNWRV
jgi:hypothetical protein